MRCNKCGSEIQEGNIFCTNCGAKYVEKKPIMISFNTAIFLIITVIVALCIGMNIIISNNDKNIDKYQENTTNLEPNVTIKNVSDSVEETNKIDGNNKLENNTDEEDEYTGIGVYLGQNNKEIYIIDTMENSPAEEAGILKDDIIISVDNIGVSEKSIDEVSGLIKGKVGSSVSIKVMRNGNEKEFLITRKVIQEPRVKSNIIENNIGYIQIISFDKGSSAQFNQVIEELVNQGVENIILDLRANAGGQLDEVEKIVELFLEKDKIIYRQLDSQGQEIICKTKDRKKYNENLVILANEYTSSASEIFIASLKENKRAKVVGTTTYGKVEIKVIKNGDETITNYEVYTPNNNKIAGNGVKPDYDIKNIDNKDKQLDKAIEILNSIKEN